MRRIAEILVGGLMVCLGGALALGAPAAHGGDGNRGEAPHCPAVTPSAVSPPVGMTIRAAMAARGVQAYVCAALAGGGAPAWTLKGPHAVLSDGSDTDAIHFSGPAPVSPPAAAPAAPAPAGTPPAPAMAPTWQALDGSRLTGAKAASAPAPDGKSIPWLLLRATPGKGAGLFSDVAWIQRLDTVGGAAPATGCDAAHLNAELLVPYRADYFFYHPAPAGASVHRCAAN